MIATKLNLDVNFIELKNECLDIISNHSAEQAGYHGEGHMAWDAITVYSGNSDGSGNSEANIARNYDTLSQFLSGKDLNIAIARVMILHPGGEIKEHKDEFLSNIARIHIPIVTNENVFFYIDDERCEWNEGEFWYGDFRKPHRGKNCGQLARVHLVIDAIVDNNIRKLFHSGKMADQFFPTVTKNEDIDSGSLAPFCIRFTLPEGFIIPGVFDKPLPKKLTGDIRQIENDLVVFLDGSPMLQASIESEKKLRLLGLELDVFIEYDFDGKSDKAARFVLGDYSQEIMVL